MKTIKALVINIALILLSCLHAQQVKTERFVNLICDNMPLSSALEKIRIQTGIDIVYRSDLFGDITISCRLENYPAAEVFEKLLKPHKLSSRFYSDKTVVIFRNFRSAGKEYRTKVVQQNDPSGDTTAIFSEPKILSRKSLVYPYDAINGRIEGDVSLKYLVTSEGNVENSRIEESSGSAILDTAAIVYSRTLKYIPAYANGHARQVWISLRIKFFITGK